MQTTTTFQSPLGIMSITTDGSCITDLNFIESATTLQKEKNSKPTPLLTAAVQELQEYFQKKRTNFTIPFSLAGTPFQKQVWDAVAKIPYGETTSYQAIAKKIGNPKAIRAVGTAIGKNPICLIIPCHRVIGTHGDLCGYAGGLSRKQKLLQLES